MENAIYKHNIHWDKPYSSLYKRKIVDKLIDRLHLRQMEVLKDIRRGGKTTICKLIINELIKKVDAKSRLYINLDDPFFSELYSDSKNLYKLLELSQKLTGVKVEYLFLDEVQNVQGWEKFVKLYTTMKLLKRFL